MKSKNGSFWLFSDFFICALNMYYDVAYVQKIILVQKKTSAPKRFAKLKYKIIFYNYTILYVLYISTELYVSTKYFSSSDQVSSL